MRFTSISFGYTRRRKIFTDFSWEVPTGLVILLGPNGAGKSTLLALGADRFRPSSGAIEHRGLTPRSNQREYRQTVGWMSQDFRPIAGFTAIEQVSYAAWLKGLSSTSSHKAASQALQAVDLASRADVGVSKLSGGQRKRVGLAMAIVNRPDVLLLDEPTAGLDPAQRSHFRDLVTRSLLASTIVISTHQVDDLSSVFGSVAVVDDGELLFNDTATEFLALGSADTGDSLGLAESAYHKIVSHGT
ncbi:MAG: ATP-binding cassette domain-containing protein [Dehalococcoidia bacterium]